MIASETLRETVAIYVRHGWLLRRILATESGEKLNEFGVPVVQSSLDAAWFSRPPGEGAVAWEIRYLGDSPFALVEFLDESDPDFEQNLDQVEQRLAESVAKRKAA